jgi:hypothetical protein
MAERPLELSKDSDHVFYGGKNTTVSLVGNGIYQPAIIFKVPRQMAWVLAKNPKVRLKLKDSAGNEISKNAKLIISIKKPGEQMFKEVGTFKLYSIYGDLTLSQQANKDYDGSVRFDLKNAGTVKEESLLALMIEAPTNFTINWTKSEIYIGSTATRDLVEVDL